MRSEQDRLEHRLRERFIRAMASYQLISDDDRILVGLSGGKDSLCLLELLAWRSRIQHPRFTIEALHVRMENIQYETSTDYLQQFCDEQGVQLHIATTRFNVGNEDASPKDLRRQKQPCFLCSWNRRKQLFNIAQERGCNKIALGHHQDDFIRTALMNLTFQGRFESMSPKLQLDKMPLSIIRPLCLIQEADIQRYAALRDYKKQVKHCPYENHSTRTDVEDIFKLMEQLNPEARTSICHALERGKLAGQEQSL
ncbi:MAG: tRNA 2-thiocytidine biosynthesis TtcA family protein [Prevotella sp.]|nr:tRNA 2-thiocytidine biosynthesis TtcA family protein [Prevotella sp.]